MQTINETLQDDVLLPPTMSAGSISGENDNDDSAIDGNADAEDDDLEEDDLDDEDMEDDELDDLDDDDDGLEDAGDLDDDTTERDSSTGRTNDITV